MTVEELQQALARCHPKSVVGVQVNRTRDLKETSFDIERLDNIERVDVFPLSIRIVVKK